MLWFLLVMAAIAAGAYWKAPVGWRTMAVKGALTAFGALWTWIGDNVPDLFDYLTAQNWHGILPEAKVGVVIMVMGALAMLLRRITTTPLGKAD